jgi:hypothetical protein
MDEMARERERMEEMKGKYAEVALQTSDRKSQISSNKTIL